MAHYRSPETSVEITAPEYMGVKKGVADWFGTGFQWISPNKTLGFKVDMSSPQPRTLLKRGISQNMLISLFAFPPFRDLPRGFQIARGRF